MIMTTNRRNFLKTATFAGAGAMTGGLISGCTAEQARIKSGSNSGICKKISFPDSLICRDMQHLPLPVVRVGVIGLGDRGSGAVERLSFIEGC